MGEREERERGRNEGRGREELMKEGLSTESRVAKYNLVNIQDIIHITQYPKKEEK